MAKVHIEKTLLAGRFETPEQLEEKVTNMEAVQDAATAQAVEAAIKQFEDNHRKGLGTLTPNSNASKWVTDLRAAIRPVITVLALCALIVGYFGYFTLDEGTLSTFCFIVGSWFGTSTNFQIGSKR